MGGLCRPFGRDFMFNSEARKVLWNKKMKQTVMMPIGDVIPYGNNPRNNKEAVAKVAASLHEFGFRQPIVVDKDNVIIVGHTRLLAAKKLRMKEVHVLIADDMTEE